MLNMDLKGIGDESMIMELLFVIGSPISPESTIPSGYFFNTVVFRIFSSTIADTPVVYELIKKNSGLSDNISIHASISL